MKATSMTVLFIDVVMAFTLIEGALLVLLHRRRGRGVPPRDFVANMASGLCLMAALRSLALDQGAPSLAAWLLAAGAAHGCDIWMRWRGPASASRHGKARLQRPTPTGMSGIEGKTSS